MKGDEFSEVEVPEPEEVEAPEPEEVEAPEPEEVEETSEEVESADQPAFEAEAAYAADEDITFETSETLEEAFKGSLEDVETVPDLKPEDISLKPDDVNIDGVAEGKITIESASEPAAIIDSNDREVIIDSNDGASTGPDLDGVAIIDSNDGTSSVGIIDSNDREVIIDSNDMNPIIDSKDGLSSVSAKGGSIPEGGGTDPLAVVDFGDDTIDREGVVDFGDDTIGREGVVDFGDDTIGREGVVDFGDDTIGREGVVDFGDDTIGREGVVDFGDDTIGREGVVDFGDDTIGREGVVDFGDDTIGREGVVDFGDDTIGREGVVDFGDDTIGREGVVDFGDDTIGDRLAQPIPGGGDIDPLAAGADFAMKPGAGDGGKGGGKGGTGGGKTGTGIDFASDHTTQAQPIPGGGDIDPLAAGADFAMKPGAGDGGKGGGKGGTGGGKTGTGIDFASDHTTQAQPIPGGGDIDPLAAGADFAMKPGAGDGGKGGGKGGTGGGKTGTGIDFASDHTTQAQPIPDGGDIDPLAAGADFAMKPGAGDGGKGGGKGGTGGGKTGTGIDFASDLISKSGAGDGGKGGGKGGAGGADGGGKPGAGSELLRGMQNLDSQLAISDAGKNQQAAAVMKEQLLAAEETPDLRSLAGNVVKAQYGDLPQDQSNALIGIVAGETANLIGDEIANLKDKISDLGQLDNLDLQNASQRQQQSLQMMSNLTKQLHDTAMSIIRNLK